MLSYQHAYHAGNPADLHKHLVLAELLTLLTRKPRGISYFETHAGRGRYDLDAVESLKTGEAAEGIKAIALPACPLKTVLNATRAKHGPSTYPGSPEIAQTLLRDQDRIQLMELHPAEHSALKYNMKAANTAVHKRDGYEGVLALSPPKPRKGLVLIDPSYEVKTEYQHVAEFTHRLITKWPEATVLIWYPLLTAARHMDLISNLKINFLRHEVSFSLKAGAGMIGSGLIMVNPPYNGETCFSSALDLAQPLLKQIVTQP